MADSDAQWYYGIDGKQHGPVSLTEVQQLAATGTLKRTDMVWQEGTADWVTAGSVPELYAQPASAAKPAESTQSATSPEPVAPATAAAAKPSKPASDLKAHARQVASEASRDAVRAFKILASNPVGGLKEAYENLGRFRAMWVGVVFALVFYCCLVVGVWMLFPALAEWRVPIPAPRPGVDQVQHSLGFTGYFLLLVLGLVPWIAAAAASALSRKIFRGSGSMEADLFIAGASLLPFGVFSLLAGFLGTSIPTIVLALGLAATCFTVLMLYSGCTNILRIPEAAATLAVPLIVVISSLVSLKILDWMLPSA